tara:strand:+ start:15614 stop:17275 length:1662 start_codon:yes stop_codon:yes gene_type:complete
VSASKKLRCAIYTRKSSEEGLEQSFNSLHAQREACEAYIKSQRHEGWIILKECFDDGGFSGGNVDRPALSSLLTLIKEKQIDIVVVYKVDRLSRSLADFVRIVDLFDQHGVSFVSVTQQFTTSSSMGRLTLNVLLSFAQFEREVTGERIRDKIAASKRKGMWMGGTIPLGYDIQEKQLVINKTEAKVVRFIFDTYIKEQCVRSVKEHIEQENLYSKQNKPFSRGALYTILKNPLYVGKVQHRGNVFDGLHQPLLDEETWKQVQTILHCNRHTQKHRVHAKQPSLLSGLLFDDQGNAMSPSHATKKNRRYRYYVSQALLHYCDSKGGSVIRIAAREIEHPVIEALLKLLQSPKQLTSLFKTFLKDALTQQMFIKKAEVLASNWKNNAPSQHIQWLQQFIEKIMVSQTHISIQLKLAGLGRLLEINHLSDETHKIEIPIHLRRCGMEMKIIMPSYEDQAIDPSTLKSIQQGLTQALMWNEQLLNGDVVSIQNIATKEYLDRSYVTRRLRLAFLAPDIIVSIFEGHLPPQLTMTTLRNGFPLDWKKQRKYLGFTEI